ncbi:dynein axonemal assembly factor 5 [Anthonomus grandis grandis]|uniref:dynein axonemal assembly factor 5 n=1 Tax=Anthonomus grandis grandis TaxID=2921223 RepID=UPI002164F806|nr:dynein axonemal assembly factor 5 [Anthonomus grandis grandis]
MVQEIDENDSQAKITRAKKICEGFQSQSLQTRKQTYIDFQQFIKPENIELSDQELRVIFSETHIYFLHGLRDKSEAIREQAIKFVTYLIDERLPLHDFYLTYIFPIIVERIGTVELIEDSEEIRLQMLQLLNSIIIKYTNTEQLKPFLNDSVIIIAECVKDKYPLIKELSCQSVVLLSKALPREFHLQAETLLDPVLTCFSHRQYKVRVEAIKAVGEIVMHSSYKGVDKAMVPMAEKLFDQIPAVRQAVAQQAARWLLNHRDRYSYFHKMLPLLLTGLNDEVKTTRDEANQLWESVGLKYQTENEKDLKDKMDYLSDPPKNYPTHLKRPNLGCRVLVQRNISKLATALSNELMSWQDDVKVRCSQLLCTFALHAEADLTFNLQSLLPAMYSAAKDDNKVVVQNIVQAGQIIGLFVSYKTWSKIVLPVLEDGPHAGHLTVVSALIEGTPKGNISNEALEAISKLLAEDYICCSRKSKFQIELLSCVRSLSKKFDSNPESTISYNLFKIVTTLISLRSCDNSDIITEKLYEELAHSLGFTGKADLMISSANKLFNHLNNNPKLWTPISENACIFLTLMSEIDLALGVNLDIIGVILSEVLDNQTDAELRLKVFHSLTIVFEKYGGVLVNDEHFVGFLEKLITDIFVPSLVWHPGSTAEAIRTMSATCLRYALMLNERIELFSSTKVLEPLLQKLLLLLLSLMEDASCTSRKVAIECVTLIKNISVRNNVWCLDDFIRIYPAMLQRLDDPIEKVRLAALKSLSKIFTDVPSNFLEVTYKTHRELIVDTLMTHFDDDDELVQNLVLETLKVLAKINTSEMLRKIEIYRPLLTNQEGLNQIESFTQSIVCDS